MDCKRLIEYVKKYPHLYDYNHPDYKNFTLKTQVWNLIAYELDQSPDACKSRWKRLRDAYVKHKKLVKKCRGKKKPQFLWSSELDFLDNFLYSNLVKTAQAAANSTSSSNKKQSAASNANAHKLLETSGLQFPKPSISPSAPSTSSCDELSKKFLVDNPYYRGKNDFDGVDYLFLSYAETFKKLPTKEQAILKVKLANLFAQSELMFLDESDGSNWQYGSPYYQGSLSIGLVREDELIARGIIKSEVIDDDGVEYEYDGSERE